RTAALLDAGQALDQRQVDELRRFRQPQLHGRQQRVAAGQDFRVFVLGQQMGPLPHRARAIEGESVHRSPPFFFPTPRERGVGDFYTACGSDLPDLRSAAHTVADVAGMSIASVPSALVMAFMTAAGAAMAPASPQPLMPSGFDGHLVKVVSTLNDGKLSARGMA